MTKTNDAVQQNRPVVGTKRRRFTSIPGFSDQPGLPRLGKIRLGIKGVSEKGTEYPKEVDYFVFDPDDALQDTERAALKEKFRELYGERPVTIDGVLFVTPDREQAFDERLNWYGKNKLLCHGNGEEAERLNLATGAWEAWSPCSNGGCPEWESKKCKLTARLRIALPQISMAGYFQLDTGSLNSSVNIQRCLNLLEALFDKIHGIPLTLSRAPQSIVYEGKATTHYIVHLWAPNVTLEEMKQIASSTMLALPAPLDIDPDDIPEDLVPASEQVDEPDPELKAKIDTGFDILGMTPANRLVSMAKWKDDLPGLLVEINSRINAKAGGAK